MDNKPDNRRNGNQDPNQNGPKNRQPNFCVFDLFACYADMSELFSQICSREALPRRLHMDKFINMVDKGQIKEVVLQDGKLTITPKESKDEGIYGENKPYRLPWQKMILTWSSGWRGRELLLRRNRRIPRPACCL